MKTTLLRNKSIPPVTLVTQTRGVGLNSVIVAVGIIGIIVASVFGAMKITSHLNGSAPAKVQISELKQQVEKLSSESQALSESTNSADSKLTIELTTQKQLANQVQALTEENNKLKEDLAFFDNLIPAGAQGVQGIRIGGFKAELIAHSQLKYRILVMQSTKNAQDFVGELQLVATVAQGGKNSSITFPDSKTGDAGKFKLSFKYYQRMEGTLSLPEGTTIKALQARIINNGQVRTEYSINL